MPHQCTECGHVFPDGSKEMLSGCPDCGGNKFQFRPASDARETDTGSGSSTGPETPPESSTSSEEETATPPSDSSPGDRDPATADSQLPKSLTPPETQDSTETGPTPDSRPNDGDTGPPPETKGDAEASSGRADPTSGTETATGPDESAIATSTDDGDDVEALRRELNDQFESIKILEPGQYELNLMELYNREERIIALKEDGQYVIDVPDTWLGDDDGS